MSLFKTQFCIIPRRLAMHIDDAKPTEPNMRFVGWVWMQHAPLVKNFNHGWVSFVGAKAEPARCSKCGQVLPI